jgi:hypothetical protein
VPGQLIYWGTAVIYLLNTTKKCKQHAMDVTHTKSNDWCRRATGFWDIAFSKSVMGRVREAIQSIIE